MSKPSMNSTSETITSVTIWRAPIGCSSMKAATSNRAPGAVANPSLPEVLFPQLWPRTWPASTHLERRLRVVRHHDHRVALEPHRRKPRQQVHPDHVGRPEPRRDDRIETARGDVTEAQLVDRGHLGG